jgi:hypothetical protein
MYVGELLKVRVERERERERERVVIYVRRKARRVESVDDHQSETTEDQ